MKPDSVNFGDVSAYGRLKMQCLYAPGDLTKSPPIGFARGLVLKIRQRATGKWPIVFACC